MNSLKEIRLSKKMSQNELANIIGVSIATISRYETGKRKISVESAKKLGEVLQVNWVNFLK